MEVLILLIGLAAGLLIGFFASKAGTSKQIISLSEKNNFLSDEVVKINEQLNLEREKSSSLAVSLAEANTNNENLKEKLDEKLKDMESLQKKFTSEFEALASKILDEKSSKFTMQNKENIEGILKPLRERIFDFEQKIDLTYKEGMKERTTLAEQIRNLQELNLKMSEEANNLTKALKGDSKAQGAWGEFLLESMLEKSGLVKGREYELQSNFTDDEGKRKRPDAIIYLPDDKNIIIDSKVSLTNYERYVSSDNDKEREEFLKLHLKSVRDHVKSLSSKNYHLIEGMRSPDFVLMFMPIEPAFALSVQLDSNLYSEAFDNNIVIVSPSTLLATLRTISSIWKVEHQNANAIEIAKRCGMLYDKFADLTKDLLEIGQRLNQTQSAYQNSMKKISEGRGNLISQIETVKELGAKASKQIPQNLLDRSKEE